MIKLKYSINEKGKLVQLHNMTPVEVQQMQKWSKHTDRLYADYDFPQMEKSELFDWYRIKTQKGRVLISICSFDGELIGYLSLRNIRRFFKVSELGIVLNPAQIEKGYGTDAIKTFLKWYFNKLKFKKLLLSVAMYNARAYKVYQKIGFVEKYKFFDTFENEEIDPTIDDSYTNIRQYFKKKKDTLYVRCIKMQISTLSTE